MQTIDTEPLQTELLAEHLERVADLDFKPTAMFYLGTHPVTHQVDPRSKSYFKTIVRYSREDVGIITNELVVPSDTIGLAVATWATSPNVDAQMVQHQPPGLDSEAAQAVYDLIPPRQDVDALTQASHHLPATPKGILRLLEFLETDIQGAVVALNGSESARVGKPIQPHLENRGAKVIAIDKKLGNELDLPDAIAESDIVISCVGVPSLVTAAMLRDQIVIDAAASFVNRGGKMVQVGDLDMEAFESTRPFRANRPVGHIGRLTTQSAISNVIEAAGWTQNRPWALEAAA